MAWPREAVAARHVRMSCQWLHVRQSLSEDVVMLPTRKFVELSTAADGMGWDAKAFFVEAALPAHPFIRHSQDKVLLTLTDAQFVTEVRIYSFVPERYAFVAPSEFITQRFACQSHVLISIISTSCSLRRGCYISICTQTARLSYQMDSRSSEARRRYR